MEKIAIEWLEEIIYYKEDFNLAEVFKQAKVKKREQIIDAYVNGIRLNLLLSDCMSHEDIVGYANKYYNETFNK